MVSAGALCSLSQADTRVLSAQWGHREGPVRVWALAPSPQAPRELCSSLRHSWSREPGVGQGSSHTRLSELCASYSGPSSTALPRVSRFMLSHMADTSHDEMTI